MRANAYLGTSPYTLEALYLQGQVSRSAGSGRAITSDKSVTRPTSLASPRTQEPLASLSEALPNWAAGPDPIIPAMTAADFPYLNAVTLPPLEINAACLAAQHKARHLPYK